MTRVIKVVLTSTILLGLYMASVWCSTSLASLLRCWNVSSSRTCSYLIFVLTFFAGLATYLLIWPKDGILRKDDIQGVLDGSTFQKHAEMTKGKQKKAY